MRKINNFICALPLFCFSQVYVYTFLSWLLNNNILPGDPKDSPVSFLYYPVQIVLLIGFIPLISELLILPVLLIRDKRHYISTFGVLIYLCGLLVIAEQLLCDFTGSLSWFVD
jgi:hypothetical protein